jgi:hypothetical protein
VRTPGCTHPASTSGNPGTARAGGRNPPHDPAKIAIQYVILYRADCGDLGGLTSHYGDVEPFSITLAPNAACPYGWGAWALKTVAHQGVPGQHTDQRFLGNECYFGRLSGASPHVYRIFASENKHGNYASEDSCDGALLGLENCSTSFTLPFNVYNVGEDHYRRIDRLDAYQFPGEYAWSGVDFEGGLGGNGCCGNAGFIRDKFLNDSLLAIAYQPPPSTECNQPAHAWYQTPSNNQHITQGQQLLVIAAGVEPGTVAQFQLVKNGGEVASYQTRWANDNCVINQEYWTIGVAPDTYQVLAVYSEPSSIGGSVIRVSQLPDLIVNPRPPSGGGGGGGGGGECGYARLCRPIPVYAL